MLLRLKSLSVSNFRALEDIKLEFSGTAEVIVEAIRLAKAILAPRIANKGQWGLISLSAISPHLPPQQINFIPLARDPRRALAT
jgi:hypothetical protein